MLLTVVGKSRITS